MQQFPQVHADGDRTGAVARGHHRIEAIGQRKMQQHRGQKTEHREAEKHDQAGLVGTIRRRDQNRQRSDVPKKSQTGGGDRKPTPAQARASPVMQQQV